MENLEPTLTPNPEEPLDEIVVAGQTTTPLPEGFIAKDYVLVKKADIQALENELKRVYTPPNKRGVTKKLYNRKEAKARRRIAKASRKINRGK